MKMITWQDKTPKVPPRVVFTEPDRFKAVTRFHDFVDFAQSKGGNVYANTLDHYVGVSINGHFSHYELVEDNEV